MFYTLATIITVYAVARLLQSAIQFDPRPDDPHRTRVSVRFYAPQAPASEEEQAFWDANIRFTTKVVFEEDFGQQQDIHRSLRSGLLPEVVYGRNEPALIHYHQQVELALSASAAAAANGTATPATPRRSPPA